MGMIDRFSQFFGLSDEEDMAAIEEFEAKKESQIPVQPKTNQKKPSMKNTQPFNARREDAKNNKVVSINTPIASHSSKIIVVEPRVYSEVQEIADLLLNHQSVVLNFSRMEKEQAKKIVDFLMGAIYAVDGDMQRIGNEIFLCTPHNVEIDGVLTDALHEKDLY